MSTYVTPAHLEAVTQAENNRPCWPDSSRAGHPAEVIP